MGFIPNEPNVEWDILVVSHVYGPPMPEGICTQRLVLALRKQGLKVGVWSGHSSLPSSDREMHRSFGSRRRVDRSRLDYIAGHLLVGAPVKHWDFVRSVSKRSEVHARIVYGRAYPLASLIAAHRVADRNGL